MYSLDYALFCSIKSKLNWDCGHNNPILYMTIKYLLIFILNMYCDAYTYKQTDILILYEETSWTIISTLGSKCTIITQTLMPCMCTIWVTGNNILHIKLFFKYQRCMLNATNISDSFDSFIQSLFSNLIETKTCMQ